MEEVGCESPLRSIAQSPSASPGRVELKRTLRSCLMCLSSPVHTSVHFPLPFHLCRVVNSPPTSSLTATSWPLPQLHFGQQLLNPPLPSWISPHPLLSAPLPSCGPHPLLSASHCLSGAPHPLLSAHRASLLSGEMQAEPSYPLHLCFTVLPVSLLEALPCTGPCLIPSLSQGSQGFLSQALIPSSLPSRRFCSSPSILSLNFAQI